MAIDEVIFPFWGFNNIPILSREMRITEKSDGTNAQIFITPDSSPITLPDGRQVPFLVGQRTRYIMPEKDNFGFAKWAYENVDELLKLGPGHHYGEWWGQGIQRKYGLDKRVFSLFNTKLEYIPACCSVVPVLYKGEFDTETVKEFLEYLKGFGSFAAPGFMKPEGIVIYHVQGRIYFKKTIENDEKPKGLPDEIT